MPRLKSPKWNQSLETSRPVFFPGGLLHLPRFYLGEPYGDDEVEEQLIFHADETYEALVNRSGVLSLEGCS